METNLLKHKNNLIIAGKGSIIFSIWALVKVLSYILFSSEVRGEMLSASTGELPQIAVIIIIVITILLVMGILLIFQLYIGLSAIAVGRRGEKRKLYLFFSFIMLISAAASIVIIFKSGGKELLALDGLSSIFIDATSAMIYAEIIYSSLKIRSLTNKLNEAGDVTCS